MEKRIKKYMMIEEKIRKMEIFNERVNNYISKGWQPYGAPFVTERNGYDDSSIFQAVVQFEDESLKEESEN